MNSYGIYKSCLMNEDDASKTILCSGNVHKTFYEHDRSKKLLYSELLQIGRVLFLARKVFNSDFKLMCKSASYLMVYIVSGSICAECEKNKIFANSGQVIVLKDNKTYSITQQNGLPLDIVIMWCKGDLPFSYNDVLKEMCISVAKPKTFISLFDELSYYCQYNNHYGHSQSIVYIAQLFCHLLQNNAFPGHDNEKKVPDAIMRSLDLLNERFDSYICMDELVQISGFSKMQFYRLFKSCTGMTPYTYLINKRIDTAKTLLLSTNYKVKHIAQMLGYSSVSHFIMHFHKYVSQTPQEYRNNFRP